MGCQAPGAPAEDPIRWQASLSWAGFDTDLRFEDGFEPSLRQHSMTLAGTRLLGDEWSLRLAAGAVLGGSLVDSGADSQDHEIGMGWQAALHVERRWLAADGWRPYLGTSLALAVGRVPLVGDAPITSGTLMATDLRLGVVGGWLVGRVWAPYLSAQVFGGPAWIDIDGRRTRGSDVHHWRPSVGSNFVLPGGVALFADLAPLGERGVAGGAAFSW